MPLWVPWDVRDGSVAGHLPLRFLLTTDGAYVSIDAPTVVRGLDKDRQPSHGLDILAHDRPYAGCSTYVELRLDIDLTRPLDFGTYCELQYPAERVGLTLAHVPVTATDIGFAGEDGVFYGGSNDKWHVVVVRGQDVFGSKGLRFTQHMAESFHPLRTFPETPAVRHTLERVLRESDWPDDVRDRVRAARSPYTHVTDYGDGARYHPTFIRLDDGAGTSEYVGHFGGESGEHTRASLPDANAREGPRLKIPQNAQEYVVYLMAGGKQLYPWLTFDDFKYAGATTPVTTIEDGQVYVLADGRVVLARRGSNDQEEEYPKVLGNQWVFDPSQIALFRPID